MENTELSERLAALERKVDATYASAEKTRKYFLTTLIVTAIAFIVPLIGLLFEIPVLLSTYSSLGGL